MIPALKRYLRLFLVTFLFKEERLILVNHFISYFFTGSFRRSSFKLQDKKSSLELAIQWLLWSQKNMKDGGMGTYYIVDGWSSSYPETSGYIIPTLYEYLKFEPGKKTEIENSILVCADWLMSIQKPSGGWQSAYIAHNRPEVVFNTGQVLRGLLVAFEISKDQKYLESLIKASDWLVQTQEENGSWIKTAFMNEPRVYDSYVAHPLIMVYEITKNENYKRAATKNLDWILSQQEMNGWFNNADNTIKHNSKPILHTISYTIDGLINSGIILNDEKYIDAGKKAADRLLTLLNENKYLDGRFDKHWLGSEYMICTGCAQISIIWSLLFKLTKQEKYQDAVKKINDQLVFIQHSCLTFKGEGNGALPGSFPIWGKYEPFGFPNWATKYFADALMMEMKRINL
jgi:hypothetical protein